MKLVLNSCSHINNKSWRINFPFGRWSERHVVVKSIGKAQFPYDHNPIAEWCDSHTLICHILERSAL